MSPQMRITPTCTSCGDCLPLCPTQSIFIGFGHFVIDTDTCDGSAVCAQVCPVNAIQPAEAPAQPSGT